MLRDVLTGVLEKAHGDPEQNIKKLRKVLVQWRDREIKSREMLEAADKILEGFGIEYLVSEKDDQWGAHGAYYVNLGDTYVPTILLDLDRNRVWATSWGDWVEAEERQGKRFP
jgi:hypothetical protein